LFSFERPTLDEEQAEERLYAHDGSERQQSEKGEKIRNNTMAVAMICSSVAPPMAANNAPIVFPVSSMAVRADTRTTNANGSYTVSQMSGF
jgi:hypothetical protein